MRNYSASNTIQFITADVNMGEYVYNDVDTGDVVMALAEAFQTPKPLVFKAWADALNGQTYTEHIAASEFQVLYELLAFSQSIEYIMNNDVTSEASNCAFTYHNLNTGRSVIWAFVVL